MPEAILNPITRPSNSTISETPIEQVELEMMLALGSAEGLDFSEAVQQAAVKSGNEFLFTLPADCFSLECDDVACIKLLSDDEPSICYIYQTEGEEGFLVADTNAVEEGFVDLANNFAFILESLQPASENWTEEHH
ncbi:MAG: hypothetical protein AAF468_12315 [Pseudomonadota bacterium]